MRVDPVTGETTGVDIQWMEPDPVRVPLKVITDFKMTVIGMLNRAKFAPQSGGPYRVCMPFEFLLS